MEWLYLEGPDNRTTTSTHNGEGGDPEIEEESLMGEGGIHVEWAGAAPVARSCLESRYVQACS